MTQKEFKRQITAAMKDVGKVLVLCPSFGAIRYRLLQRKRCALFLQIYHQNNGSTLLDSTPDGVYPWGNLEGWIPCCWDPGESCILSQKIDALWAYHYTNFASRKFEIYGIDKNNELWSYK